MSDSILQKYTSRSLGEGDAAGDPEQQIDDLGPFGFLRATRERALMLELRRKTGNIRAIGYAWLERAEFDPSEGITLFAAGQKIRLVGQHLAAEIRPNVCLFQGLIRHRIAWVQEADEAAIMRARPGVPLIEKIEW